MKHELVEWLCIKLTLAWLCVPTFAKIIFWDGCEGAETLAVRGENKGVGKPPSNGPWMVITLIFN